MNDGVYLMHIKIGALYFFHENISSLTADVNGYVEVTDKFDCHEAFRVMKFHLQHSNNVSILNDIFL